MNTGTLKTGTLKTVPLSAAVSHWSELFDLSNVTRHRCETLAHSLRVSRDDVLTAKLPQTVNFYRAATANIFHMLPNCIGDLNSILDIFSELSTFDTLARAEFAPVKTPIFWMKSSGSIAPSIVPALPMNMAASLCGVARSTLRVSLMPLVKDGALDIVRSPTGFSAIVMKPGFINGTYFQHHLKSRHLKKDL